MVSTPILGVAVAQSVAFYILATGILKVAF